MWRLKIRQFLHDCCSIHACLWFLMRIFSAFPNGKTSKRLINITHDCMPDCSIQNEKSEFTGQNTIQICVWNHANHKTCIVMQTNPTNSHRMYMCVCVCACGTMGYNKKKTVCTFHSWGRDCVQCQTIAQIYRAPRIFS